LLLKVIICVCTDRNKGKVSLTRDIWRQEKDGRTPHFSVQYGQVGRQTARTETEVNYDNHTK